MIAAAVYFIGHLQSTAREYWLQGADIKWWARIILALAPLSRSSIVQPQMT